LGFSPPNGRGTMRKTTVVPDIKPLELYDFSRAKIRASLGWILGKTFGTAENVPVELRDPFYCDQYEQEHIKPPVTHLLLSSELYSRAYGLLLGSRVGAAAPPRDNAALLQLLANKGTAPKDQGALVTESDLRMKPIKMSAHLAVIDSLMVVSAMETVSAAQLQSGPEQLGGGASWEKALFYWVNLVGPTQSQFSNRYRKDKMVPRHPPVFPVVTSVKDLSSGCVLAAVIHFYCPNLLRLEDVCWKDTMSAADSLYNLQLIRDFCDGCLKSCCSLALEDFLYSPPVLKLNIMSFLAELLNWFEVQKPDFVHPLEALNLEGTATGAGAFSHLISVSVCLGSLTQSASMSHVEGVGRTWTKKPFSRPLSSAVSFSIPFGLDSDVEVVMGNPVNPITRSVSSDSLNPMGQAMTRAPYTPPEDLSHLGTDLPTIEEALQIIHNESKLEPRLHPEGAPDGFYLHSPDDSTSIRHNGTPAPLSSSAPPRSGMMYRVGEDTPTAPVAASTPTDRPPATRGEDLLDSGVKMTSFAERKKKLASDLTTNEVPLPQMTWTQKSEESPSKSPALNTEMSELGARLEEKRRAIEAQKKRIEAIFAKHRQRLGKSAFLQLKREQQQGEPGEESEERLTHVDDEEQRLLVEETGKSNAVPVLEKQVTFSKEPAQGDRGGPAPLGDYNYAVSKLSAALSSLQTDMQRLSEQQNQLMRKKAAASTQAWVIPAGPKPVGSPAPRFTREHTREPPSAASSQHHQTRPLELKFPPLTRVLTPPQNVDTLPHLRRVSPRQCQVQTSSSFSLGTLSGKRNDGTDAFSDSMSDQTEPEMKSGVGFFFKDESRPEDEMEKRRAALLEKQQKRTEEMKRRRQEQEREREARMANLEEPRAQGLGERPQTPCTPPPTRTPPPEGTPQRRGDFTRQEYERRMQLKIMEDLDKVLRQKPTTVRGVKKQRPKTVFRDDSVLSRSPAKGFAGSRLNKVYSHSTLSLSTMANDTGNSGSLAVRKSPSRSHSPSRLMSPGRLASQNGEKDWENASTISSPASVPEYTGPKLYKEPSFKSNKFIIHNAISRCCLAGKVNEPQKNKMVEEMEKSTANHFLILFRDSSCQFRAVYTMNPETEELVRLAGTGPRVVSCSLVESMYKYSSDRKQFTPIPSKTMSMSVDAFTIPAYLWQNKKPGTPKKPSTPK
uniref:Calmodulin regulated spectrin associated protein family member 3 n=1 Tax=Scleropages formosus TaxID=113540 RepID=A0A8C9T9Z2_SCLFO